MTEAVDILKKGLTKVKSAGSRVQTKEPEIHHRKKITIPLAEQIFGANRNNIFFESNINDPRHLSFEELRVYRIGNLRFITDPVQVNEDGTHTYTITRTGPGINPATVVIVRDPNFDPEYQLPTDKTPKLSFRGDVKGNGITHWVNLEGKKAEPYAKEFLASMNPPIKT